MEELALLLNTFNPISSLVRLLLAALCGGLVGMERGRHGRAAGLRTHSLVCLGAALAAQVGLFVTDTLGYASDPLRVGAQVISGIGFLGVGTILVKGRFQVTGLTTAAGLWATAAIGLASGIGYYEGVLICTLLTIITVTLLSRVEARLNRRHRRFGIYVELRGADYVQAVSAFLSESYGAADIQVTPPRSALPNFVGLEATVTTHGSKHPTPEEVINTLATLEGVAFSLESV